MRTQRRMHLAPVLGLAAAVVVAAVAYALALVVREDSDEESDVDELGDTQFTEFD